MSLVPPLWVQSTLYFSARSFIQCFDYLKEEVLIGFTWILSCDPGAPSIPLPPPPPPPPWEQRVQADLILGHVSMEKDVKKHCVSPEALHKFVCAQRMLYKSARDCDIPINHLAYLGVTLWLCG